MGQLKSWPFTKPSRKRKDSRDALITVLSAKGRLFKTTVDSLRRHDRQVGGGVFLEGARVWGGMSEGRDGGAVTGECKGLSRLRPKLKEVDNRLQVEKGGPQRVVQGRRIVFF